MFKLPDLSNLDVQGALDKLVSDNGLGQYIESITYLANDAPAPPNTVRLGIYFGEQKVEVAIDPKGFLVEKLVEAGLAVL